MNIVIPMVGQGLRIKEYFNCPKPLVKIKNKYLIEHCIETIDIPEANYYFITREFQEFPNDSFNDKLNKTLCGYTKLENIITLDHMTQGAAETCLTVKKIINPNEELMIINCDQILNWNPKLFFKKIHSKDADAAVTTYDHPNITVNKPSPYSFIKLNKQGYAVQFEEKFAISKWALNGLHYWKNAQLFFDSAEEMIRLNDRVNNEFYISKTFNYLINDKNKIINFHMKPNDFIALGTTEEILNYDNNYHS